MTIFSVPQKPKSAVLFDIFVPGSSETNAYLAAMTELFSLLDEEGFALVLLRAVHGDCVRDFGSATADSAAVVIDPVALCAAGIGRTSRLSFGIFFGCGVCGSGFFDRPAGVLAKQVNSLDFCSGGRMRIALPAENGRDEAKSAFSELVGFLCGKVTVTAEKGTAEFELKPKYAHEEGFLPLGVFGTKDCVVTGIAKDARLAFLVAEGTDGGTKEPDALFRPTGGRFADEYVLCESGAVFSGGEPEVAARPVNPMFDFGETPPEKIIKVLKGSGRTLRR